MNNSEEISYQERLEAAWPALDRLSPRLDMLEKEKSCLLFILNHVSGVRQTISKIQSGEIIMTKEFNQLDEFVRLNGLSTKFSFTWEVVRENQDEQYDFEDMNSLSSLIHTYPYIVDADQIVDYWSLFDGMTLIRKDGKAGIIKKWIDTIEYLLKPNTYTWVLATRNDEYKKYGVLQILGHIEKGDKLENDYRDTTFLKIENLEYSLSRNIYEIWRFNLITDFDKDNIAVAIGDDGRYYFVHKHFVDRDNTQIYQLGPSFVSDTETAKLWFNKYNSFPLHGKEIYRKTYDIYGKFTGIDVFKKSLIGKETLVGNYETSK